jgi:Cu-Zn family superoxide dismutase
MKQVLLAVATLALVAAGTAFAHGKQAGGNAERVFTLQPDPAGNPEGVEYDRRNRAFYVSSTADGAIYRGTLDSDTVTPYIPGGAGKAAVGLEVRRNHLYVAGGPTGTITVYDLATKNAVATFQTGAGGFLNDLVVTPRGDVYVTDSFRPTLWHVTREQVEAGGGTPQALDVSSGIPYQAQFNLNGIVAKTARKLVVVQTNTGKLFRIDLAPGGDAISAIDEIEGVSLPGGDGMILDRGKLVVVQGGASPQLSFVKLKSGATRAESRGTLTSAKLRGPSTVARAKQLYLVVNADFASSTKPFTVAGLPARGAGKTAALSAARTR